MRKLLVDSTVATQNKEVPAATLESWIAVSFPLAQFPAIVADMRGVERISSHVTVSNSLLEKNTLLIMGMWTGMASVVAVGMITGMRIRIE